MLAMKQLGIVFILFYLAIILYLFLQQKNFIFFPTKAKHNISDKNIRPYSITNDTITLHGWMINQKFAADRLIIYYGGNAEDIFYGAEQFRRYGDTAALLVNYRGYGGSSGSPGEKELFADALEIFDEIQSNYAPKKIFLMGRSLGSGIASYVGAHRKTSGIILITPFDSIESLARRQFPFLPVSFLLQHKFRSIDYVQQFSAPALIIYGGKDRIVPMASTRKLIEKIKDEPTVIFIEEAEHNNIELFDQYDLAILQFIQ